MNNFRKTLVTTLIILMLTAMIVPLLNGELITDKQDYTPTDTVYLTGTGFIANHKVDLTLIGPEGFTPYSWSVTSDENGGFQTSYSGGLMDGLFTLTATDGTTTQITTFTDSNPGLNFFGTDGIQHPTIGSIQNLGSISKGTDLTGSLEVQGTGLGNSGSIDWTISWVSYGDASTLGPITALTPATGTVDHSDADDTVGLKIPTGSLTVGQTYQGELQLTGTGVSGTALYYFKFTVTAPTPTDTTAPVVTLSIPTPTGSNGWFKTSPVVITATAVDPSGVTAIQSTGDGVLSDFQVVSSTTATAKITVSGDGIYNIVATATDGASPSNTGASAGSSNKAEVKIDTTAPTVTISTTPSSPNGQHDWFTESVDVTVSASDATSGVSSLTVTVNGPVSNVITATDSTTFTLSTDGTYTVDATALDDAGNTGSATQVTIKIDSTAPSTSLTTDPTSSDGKNGWYISEVTVTLAASDSGSGVDATYYTLDEGSKQTYADSFVISDDGIHTVVYWSVDQAGNEEVHHTATIYVDQTPPIISGVRTPAANSYGWNNVDVIVSFTASDATSGIDTVISGGNTLTKSTDGTYDVVVSTEGAGQSVTATATDVAGNTASATVKDINIDKTKPAITINAPTASSYTLNQPVTADWSVSDSLSGIASQSATLDGNPISEGAALATSVGSHTFTVTATDKAGNIATATITYSVKYNFGGFLPPIGVDGQGLFKAGSTVPVKFQFTDYYGVPVSTASATLCYKYVSGTTIGTELDASSTSAATTGNLFRYDSISQQYIFNWGTKSLATGTYLIFAYSDDGNAYTATISLKK